MALKHVKQYYKDLENQYLEMVENTADFQEAFDKNLISMEQFDQAKDMIDKLKSNYDRISYIMFLLNLPNSKTKNKKYNKNKLTKSMNEYFSSSNADLNCIINENKDVLDRFKKMVKESRK